MTGKNLRTMYCDLCVTSRFKVAQSVYKLVDLLEVHSSHHIVKRAINIAFDVWALPPLK